MLVVELKLWLLGVVSRLRMLELVHHRSLLGLRLRIRLLPHQLTFGLQDLLIDDLLGTGRRARHVDGLRDQLGVTQLSLWLVQVADRSPWKIHLNFGLGRRNLVTGRIL